MYITLFKIKENCKMCNQLELLQSLPCRFSVHLVINEKYIGPNHLCIHRKKIFHNCLGIVSIANLLMRTKIKETYPFPLFNSTRSKIIVDPMLTLGNNVITA